MFCYSFFFFVSLCFVFILYFFFSLYLCVLLCIFIVIIFFWDTLVSLAVIKIFPIMFSDFIFFYILKRIVVKYLWQKYTILNVQFSIIKYICNVQLSLPYYPLIFPVLKNKFIHLFFAVQCLYCCMGFSVVVASRGNFLVWAHWLFTVVASLVSEHGL